MTFSEKLDTLMNVTGISNAELSRLLDVDRSTVSRLRTGARGLPKPPMLARISECFAGSYNSANSYKTNALAELVSDTRLRHSPSKKLVADILAKWMTADSSPHQSMVGDFISNVQSYEASGGESYTPSTQLPASLVDSNFAVYAGKAGKRQALLDFLDYAFRLNSPCTLRVFTDESTDWLVEDDVFSDSITAQIRNLTVYGYRFQRVQPPESQLEYTFRSIERWLPAYMAGAVTQLFYPFERDDLHRRTLFVIPGRMAMLSSSIANQRDNLVTLLTTDSGMVSACSYQYDVILERCREAMIMHPFDRPQEQFDCLVDLASIDAEGIYKSASLSAATMPSELIERIGAGDSELAAAMSDSFKMRAAARARVLENRIITDIMYLQPISTVLAGKAPIPNTRFLPSGQMYYTPAEYASHIERILWYLENFLNYRAVLTDDPLWNDIIIYAKDGAHSLLVKESHPSVIFEITERSMSDSIWDYLRRISDSYMTVGSREKTVLCLQSELNSIHSFLSRHPSAKNPR